MANGSQVLSESIGLGVVDGNEVGWNSFYHIGFGMYATPLDAAANFMRAMVGLTSIEFNNIQNIQYYEFLSYISYLPLLLFVVQLKQSPAQKLWYWNIMSFWLFAFLFCFQGSDACFRVSFLCQTAMSNMATVTFGFIYKWADGDGWIMDVISKRLCWWKTLIQPNMWHNIIYSELQLAILRWMLGELKWEDVSASAVFSIHT